jgi:hypothetical protein
MFGSDFSEKTGRVFAVYLERIKPKAASPEVP